MTEPVIALLIVLCFIVALAAVRFFKTIETDFVEAWQTPLLAGAFSGVALRVLGTSHPIAVGIILTIAVLYVRLTGRESEPVDGMILGACAGAAASVPLIIRSIAPCRDVTECLLAGAVAGYGVTFAALHVANKVRQYAVDVITAAVAIGAAFIPFAFARHDCAIAIGVAAAIPAIVIMVVLKQWPDVRAELSHEASMGFMADADVRRTAHPFLRLGSGGWRDHKAHREFVRLANKIALRKRQQRNRPDEIARLYQLEIIKLRMQIEAMSRINRDAIEAQVADTMAPSK
jgi:hypothetical protein